MTSIDLKGKLETYAKLHGLLLSEPLGAGVQGIVFSAENQAGGGKSALKIHRQEAGYLREKSAYIRLAQFGITTIRKCKVPEMIAFDDELLVIELTVVTRPFVLDFGGAYLDHPPDFSDEVMAEWRANKQDQFGSRLTEVQAILNEL